MSNPQQRTIWQRWTRWWNGKAALQAIQLERDKRKIIRLIAMAEVEKEQCSGDLKIMYINLIWRMRSDLAMCRRFSP